MLELTHDDFSRHLNEVFLLRRDGGGVELVLVRVEPYQGDVPDYAARHPFSLQFAAPPGPVLPQSIYRLEHSRLGGLDIFLVPIASDRQRVLYQAVFS